MVTILFFQTKVLNIHTTYILYGDTMSTHGATVQVIEGGRITIPSEVRKVENIEEGDFIKITITPIKDRNIWNKKIKVEWWSLLLLLRLLVL